MIGSGATGALAVRPGGAGVVTSGAASVGAGALEASLPAVISHTEFLGATVRYGLAMGGLALSADAPFESGAALFKPGDTVFVTLPLENTLAGVANAQPTDAPSAPLERMRAAFMNALHTAHWPAARAALFERYAQGLLKPHVEVLGSGLDAVPDAVEALLAGQTMGKAVVKL